MIVFSIVSSGDMDDIARKWGGAEGKLGAAYPFSPLETSGGKLTPKKDDMNKRPPREREMIHAGIPSYNSKGTEPYGRNMILPALLGAHTARKWFTSYSYRCSRPFSGSKWG